MIDFETKIREFHQKYNHYTGLKDVKIPGEILKLRRKLIMEEAIKFADACELMQSAKTDDDYVKGYILAADAIGDLLYVTFGAGISFDVPIDSVFLEIHHSNMTKSIMKNEYGKTIKGPTYKPPRIAKILGFEEV